MRTRSLIAKLCVVSMVFVLMLTGGAFAKAQQAPATYNSSFSIAEQSIDPQGHTVVIMKGTGDLPGVLTLVLTLGSDGSITGGQWALNVSYVTALHPDAQPVYNSADPDSAQGEQLVQKGVLSGSIGSGSATSANGVVSAINSLQLVVGHGTMQFAAVTKGTGTVVGTHIDDRASSSAYTTLTF